MPPVRRHTATQQDTISEVPEINLDLKHMPYFESNLWVEVILDERFAYERVFTETDFQVLVVLVLAVYRNETVACTGNSLFVYFFYPLYFGEPDRKSVV